MERSTSVAVVEIVDLFLIVGINTKMIGAQQLDLPGNIITIDREMGPVF